METRSLKPSDRHLFQDKSNSRCLQDRYKYFSDCYDVYMEIYVMSGTSLDWLHVTK